MGLFIAVITSPDLIYNCVEKCQLSSGCYIGRTIMDAARRETQYSTEFQDIDRQCAVPGVR